MVSNTCAKSGGALFAPGLVSVTFRSLQPCEVIGLVKAAQLAVIEWGGDVHVPHGDLARAREVGAATRAAGLSVAAYGSYYRAAHSDTAALPAAERLPFERVLETALALGAPLIRVWAGSGIDSQTATAEQRQAVAGDLVQIAEQAAAAGLRVATEFHGGTFTDTNASARTLLLEEACHSSLYSYWQPPVGMADAECVEGLRTIAPRLAHLHVFQWRLNAQGQTTAQPLAVGRGRWREFLSVAATTAPPWGAPQLPRAAMLEFVPDGTAESFRREAQTLRELLGCA